MEIDLKNPDYFLNREISTLHFIERVLSQATQESIPLLERLHYLMISASNLDEFFEIRVANLKRRSEFGNYRPGADSLGADELLTQISNITQKIVKTQYAILNGNILPALKEENIFIVDKFEWDSELKKWAASFFDSHVLPVLSPIGLDRTHPFPKLVNKSLNFFVTLEGVDAFGRDSGYAIVHTPRALKRLIALPSDEEFYRYISLSDTIYMNIEKLFPGMAITGIYQFRLTRNSDLELDEEESEDLPEALKSELFSRRYGRAVRLEIAKGCPETVVNFLLDKHSLTEKDCYLVKGPVNLNRYQPLLDIDREDLRFPSYHPVLAKALQNSKDIFSVIKQKDILLYHPFETFLSIIDLINQAAHDPHVRVIKATLYRSGVDSKMVYALEEAARSGKEVTVVIELRARFDEEENIELANRLHEAGALVVYGVLQYKTHAKMLLFVREEDGALVRYAHLSTGNYHTTNAKLYTDIGLLTFDKDITSDVQHVFQQLTGMGKIISLKKLYQAPFNLYDSLVHKIENEIANSKSGKKSHIMLKMNSLTEKKIIRWLYRASIAGVRVELIVRGACSLRPGIKDLSENITVHAIVDRFLEHTRIFYFYNDGHEDLYCSSADWMDRNLFHRVELCFPIEANHLKRRIIDEGLLLYLNDHCQSWTLQADGSYQRVKAQSEEVMSAQAKLISHYSANKK